ncbi:hypothetical protein GLYMA_02G030750v4 [Glycine max]|nr:hypothetical protein GLYMA_02G030750v4 [Glycine max]KAH1058474.1 hypothetical protein GYH30_002861 [Glycine max]
MNSQFHILLLFLVTRLSSLVRCLPRTLLSCASSVFTLRASMTHFPRYVESVTLSMNLATSPSLQIVRIRT